MTNHPATFDSQKKSLANKKIMTKPLLPHAVFRSAFPAVRIITALFLSLKKGKKLC